MVLIRTRVDSMLPTSNDAQASSPVHLPCEPSTPMKTKKKTILIFLGASALVLGAAPVRADDVTDSIDEAVKAYKDGDYATAATSLDAAAQLVRQKRAEVFLKFLPPAPSGWTAEEPETTAAGSAMLGGGITAEGRYTKDESSATVKIVTDSPMMSAMMMMMNNPMLLNSSDSGKMERIKGQKALVKYNNAEKDGEINIAVGGAILVTITGSDLTAAELKAFAEGIDYGKLASAH